MRYKRSNCLLVLLATAVIGVIWALAGISQSNSKPENIPPILKQIKNQLISKSAQITPTVEQAEVQLIDLKKLKAGDEFIFSVATPKYGFAGHEYIDRDRLRRPKQPQGPQDYDKRLLRMEVSSIEVGGSVVNITADEVDPEGKKWEDNKYSLKLTLRDDNTIKATSFGDFLYFLSDTFPFSCYPKTSTLPSSAEYKQRVKAGLAVTEYTYKQAKDGQKVIVEVRHYSGTQETNLGERTPGYVDVMEWPVGSLFFSTLERKNSDGDIILRCEFVSMKSADSKAKDIEYRTELEF